MMMLLLDIDRGREVVEIENDYGGGIEREEIRASNVIAFLFIANMFAMIVTVSDCV